MLTDKKGKLFGKINVIDFMVLVVLLLMIAGVGYKFYMDGRQNAVSNSQLLEYKVSIINIRNFTADAVEINDKIYDNKTGSFMGKVINKEVKPYKEYITKTDGTVAFAEKPGRLEMILTLQVPGVENNYSFLANGNRDINRQSLVYLDSKLISVEGRVVDVKRLK